jgi:hypothetical protein
MLCVRIDGREVETTPVALARMVLDGRVDRSNPAKPSGADAEQSLEQSLASSYAEALTCELLQRLRAMYSLGSSDVDLQDLRLRVEDLCQWRWTHPQVAARFFWTAAWLNELMDRLESAVGFYDAFLQMSSRESLLRLLAYNNRGVLRVRLGRLEGVQDLARAGIADRERRTGESAKVTGAAGPQATGLPTACFNLLNLINVSLRVERLTQAVDEELVDFFLHLPEETRTRWLGAAEPGEGGGQNAEGLPGLRSTGVPTHPAETPDETLLILRDPTFRRLNTLTAHLAVKARRFAAGESGDGLSWLASKGSQLSLWECRFDDDGLAREDHRGPAGPATGECDGYAEAASLLLSDDIPSSLVRLESPLSRAEQFALEELADIEDHLALHRRDLARSRLQAQRRILSSLNRNGRLAGLLTRIDAQLERIAQLEAQNEQLEFQRACTRLISEVEQFCRVSDLCRVEREHRDLDRRLQSLKAQAAPQGSREAVGLLDELKARLDRHVRRLRRLEIRKRIREPLRQVRRNWPADRGEPVRESAYQALAQCHLNDPEGWVRNWSELREQLDGHQGQYHLHAALTALQAGHVVWGRVEEQLVLALSLKPDLWLTMAPWFGLSSSPIPVGARNAEADPLVMLRANAHRLFTPVLQEAAAPGEAGGRSLLGPAGELLGRTFQQVAADARKVVRLWQCVETTLSPVLAQGDAEAIAEVRTLAERCLDFWPALPSATPGPADPRNPVNLFLESIERARRLADAERLLHARPPRRKEAGTHFAGIIDAGLDTREQLRRAVTGWYLAGLCRQDAPLTQRRVLTHLENWVETMAEEVKQHLRPQDVVGEIERARVDLADDRKGETTGTVPPENAPGDSGRETALQDGSADTRDGSETDQGNLDKDNNRLERRG